MAGLAVHLAVGGVAFVNAGGQCIRFVAVAVSTVDRRQLIFVGKLADSFVAIGAGEISMYRLLEYRLVHEDASLPTVRGFTGQVLVGVAIETILFGEALRTLRRAARHDDQAQYHRQAPERPRRHPAAPGRRATPGSHDVDFGGRAQGLFTDRKHATTASSSSVVLPNSRLSISPLILISHPIEGRIVHDWWRRNVSPKLHRLTRTVPIMSRAPRSGSVVFGAEQSERTRRTVP